MNDLRKYDAPQLIGKAITHIDTDQKIVALTFDDGPTPLFTSQIINLLTEYDAKATFFVLGRNAVNHPNKLKLIYEAGHEIGNHSWDHKRLILKSPSYIRNQILSTDSIIKASGYEKEIYFRAPFGNKLFVLPWVLKKLNKKHVLFDNVVNDWDGYTKEKLMKSVDQLFKPGSIIDLHETKISVELTSMILEKYSKEGYRFVTISELLSYENE
jgi:peptidoglycan/xylan/chitin deacetylase (PgdA/CDA1 family)